MADAAPPPGKLKFVITYLEMRAPPRRASVLPAGGGKMALMRAAPPTVSFYRYLYDTVGAPWFWYERRAMTDEDLAGIIGDGDVAIYVLYANGVPAGFAELDCRVKGDIELAYFGLIPDFVGRGLGMYLLAWTAEEAWRREPRRLWVHTCNFDHPRAVHVYQRAGFVPYRQETKLVDDPRLNGLIPPSTPLPEGARA